MPTGSVTIQDGVVTLGTVPLNGSGTASFSTSVLNIGSNDFSAVYSGDSHYASAVSNPASVAVTSTAQLQLMPGIISDFAGVYAPGFNNVYSGDGGLATSANFNQPLAVAVDANDNVYILDQGNDIVRVVYSGRGNLPGISNPIKGNVYLIAGTPQSPCTSAASGCGDNGPATKALLTAPLALAVDAAGSLYIADSTYRLRKVDVHGTITTIAGTGVQGYSGDGGPATAAETGLVQGLAVDNAGNVYLSDTQNFAIRKIDAISGVITTFAGTGTIGYTPDGNLALSSNISPGAVALDTAGDLFVVDSGVVRKIDAQTGVLTTVAGRIIAGSGYSGDGGPAINAQFSTIGGLAVDQAGNIYISDRNNQVIRVVNAISGMITPIAGTPLQSCDTATGYAPPCGDPTKENLGLATSALLDYPQGVAIGSQGNLYIADQDSNVIRKVSGTTSAMDFGSQNQGTTATQTVTLTNTGQTLLILSGLAFSDPSFSQQSSGGSDCSSTTTLKAGEQCQIAVEFFPVQASAISGTLTINSSASNVSQGQTIIPLSGQGVSLGGTQPQTISFPSLSASINYGQTISLNAVASSGLPIVYLVSGPGKLKGATLTPIGVGAITVTAYQFGEDQFGHATQYAAAAPVSQTITAIGGVTLAITAQDESYVQGTPVPALNYSISGLVNGDVTTGAPSLTTSATLTSPVGTYPIVITQGTLQAPGVYQMKFVNGTMHVTGNTHQTINFAPVGNLTYGTSPVPLVATANSGDPVVFFVTSGPAQISGTASAPTLTVTGAGSVTIAAVAYGDATYKASAPVSQTITVAKHSLTITATNVTLTQGQPIPPLNTPGYAVDTSQLVNGDTIAVLSGSPVLTTTATQNSPVGSYPILIAQGTLTAANYALNFINGSLTIVQGKPQTVTFPPIANATYGTQPITLGAGASSGLPVSYSIQPGAGTNIAKISGNTVVVIGAGTVTVVAAQSGNSTYAPATATQTFIVNQAVVTITAANATRVNNVPNPPLIGFTVSGLVNGDGPSVISGTPSETTTALPGSPVGTYPISIAQGTLAAANYTSNLVPGTLTITPGGPVPDFSLTASPQQLTMLAGQTRQAVIVLSPTNYYQGLVKLSCGRLPSNVSCTFSPATLAPDGAGNPVQTALTVNTSSSSPVVGALQNPQGARISLSAVFYLPGALLGMLFAVYRKRFAKHAKMQCLLIALLFIVGTAGLTACGGGNSPNSGNSGNASPGTSTITVTVTGADSVTHSISLGITVE
jgi:sugar lactone lactonase YvrE